MADISRFLNAIMAAVKGEEVRGSIHDAIDIINKAQEIAISSGTAIRPGDTAPSDFYNKALYINTETDELLRCNVTTWVKVGSIRGNGISEITGPETTGLDDTYTIHYTDGEEVEFTVHNGKGIVSVSLKTTVGLVDTYEILYNDGNSDTFEIKNGNAWYYGIAVSGTSSTTPATFVLPFAVREGDSYLNISNDSIYHCVAGAVAGGNSSWVFDFTITSASTGTNNYNMLFNLPKINTVEIKGAMSGHDLGLQDELTEGTGIHIDSTTKEISADVDLWLSNGSGPIIKPMPVDSTSVTFTTAEMATVVANGWAVKAYFSTAVGTAAPTFKRMIENADGSLTITFSKVKAAQAAGGACNCKLRILK